MNAAALQEEKTKEVHVVTPETVRSTNLGWFLLLVLGSAAVCHVTLGVFLALVSRMSGR
jgi:hypothetical protein